MRRTRLNSPNLGRILSARVKTRVVPKRSKIREYG